MFYGIVVYMHAERGERHNKPHLHARYQDNEIAVDFEGNVLEGELPMKKLRMLLVWMDLHVEELEANWSILQEGGDYFRIDPLR